MVVGAAAGARWAGGRQVDAGVEARRQQGDEEKAGSGGRQVGRQVV